DLNGHSWPRQRIVGSSRSSHSRRISAMLTTGSSQLIEKRLCVFEIVRVEAFGEPAIDLSEHVASFGAAALVTTEPGEAHGTAKFRKVGVFQVDNAHGYAIKYLGACGTPLP